MYIKFRNYLRLLVIVSGACIAGATCATFAARLFWMLDLLCHFRVQYAVGLGVCTVLSCLMQRWRLVGVWGVFLVLNLAVILPYYMAEERLELPSALSCIALNVNMEFGDPARVADYLSHEQPDVLLLQEVSEAWLSALAPVLAPYTYRHEVPRDDNFGIALYSRIAFTNATTIPSPQYGLPAIQATLQLPGAELDLLGVHTVPPKSSRNTRARNLQLGQLAAKVDITRPAIIVGDFNISPWSPHFKAMLKQSGLRDSMRGFGIQPSWNTVESWTRIPIDHVLVSAHIAVIDRRIGPHVGSDHYPVEVRFALK